MRLYRKLLRFRNVKFLRILKLLKFKNRKLRLKKKIDSIGLFKSILVFLRFNKNLNVVKASKKLYYTCSSSKVSRLRSRRQIRSGSQLSKRIGSFFLPIKLFKLDFICRSFNAVDFNHVAFDILSEYTKSYSCVYIDNVPSTDLGYLNAVRMVLLRNSKNFNFGRLERLYRRNRLLFNSIQKSGVGCSFPQDYSKIVDNLMWLFNYSGAPNFRKKFRFNVFEMKDLTRRKNLFTRVFINFTLKNVFFSAANDKGRPFFSCSCGVSGAKGKDKVNSYYVFLSSLKVFQKIISAGRENLFVCFYISGFCTPNSLNLIFINLFKFKLRAVFVKNYTPLPFSKGLRARKPRRI